jgi:hypothetical protein
MPAPVLPITLVIVSDFEPGPKTWDDEDDCLRRALADPYGIPAEVVIAAASSFRDTAPPDWSDLPVPVRLIFADSVFSGTIKNAATEHAGQELVAVVEADCLSTPGWLAELYRTFLAHPGLDAVTGLTMYEPTSAMRRVAALYDRGYLEERLANGDAKHVSNNGALYRKPVLMRFPFPDDPNPFVSAHLRHNTMRAANTRVGLAREAVQYHAYGGWPFIADVRKNKGLQYQIMRAAMLGTTPGGLQKIWWSLRMIPAGMATDLAILRRSFGTFCRPVDLPLALVFPFLVRPFELWGAALAHARHRAVPGTSYR